MALDPELLVGLAPGASVRSHPVAWPHAPAQQFAAGRRAAAAALAAAGSAERTVPRAADGRPVFPRAFAGSISHTDRLAVAVVVPGAAAVGVDIESTTIGPRETEFVLRERELRLLLAPVGEYTARDLFAAKEAAFKAMSGTGAQRSPFWRIELSRCDGLLTASGRDASVPVWVKSKVELSFALAIRH